MIKREHLKQAIDIISIRNHEAGYTLDEMLGRGMIDVPKTYDSSVETDEFYFIFNEEKVPVKRFIFFNDGTAGIEQQLLIKYGEMIKLEELRQKGQRIDYRTVLDDIHKAGLRFMVTHEINLLMDQLKEAEKTKDIGNQDDNSVITKRDRNGISSLKKTQGYFPGSSIISFLEQLKTENVANGIPKDRNDPNVLYQGIVDRNIPALFLPFPYSMESLMQMADMNLEFFHVRFLLNCLVKQLDGHLFVCDINQKIAGMVFIMFHHEMFYHRLEIKYIASHKHFYLPHRTPSDGDIKGIGTFLVAGIWLLWKNQLNYIKELSLDSEIGANRFYESIGFGQKRLFRYELKRPKGHLLLAIIQMAENCSDLSAEVVAEIDGMIAAQAKYLSKRGRRKKADSQREPTVRFISTCLHSTKYPQLVNTAIKSLYRYKRKIPEASHLLNPENEIPGIKEETLSNATTCQLAVVSDMRFTGHLENIFHLENAKRIRTFESLLNNASLCGKWRSVVPRIATVDELMWIHTPEYIESIAKTAGKSLTSLDLDTQATEKSYEVACLAVGAVFSILDDIMEGRNQRGFAAIRPPGHHAEPNKAMGFCIFNNVALGAKYLSICYNLKKVLIVDIDAHHGNGTQATFYHTDEVLFISLHQFPAYPGTGNIGEVGVGKGEGFNVNIPLRKGCGDKEYAQAIHRIIDPIAREYQPEIVLVSCGFDLYLYDRLAGMKVTPEGYAYITHLLVDMAERLCGGRIIFVLEGGYSIKGIEACGLRVIQQLCDFSPHDYDPSDKAKEIIAPLIPQFKKVVEVHRKYWKNLYPP